jgi:hypothetical protein
MDEDINSFSEEYAAGHLANEDDDYYIDELENLRDLQDVFLEKLEVTPFQSKRDIT